MAIPHLNRTHIRRSQGASIVAKAAYNARQQLYDERTGTTHDYTRHSSKCIFEGLYLPKAAPEWAADRAELWNRAERSEKRKDAQLGQTVEIALPHELTHEQNRWLLQDFVRENFTRKGLAADVAIHAPSTDMDDRNIHAHILIPDRQLSGEGFAKTKPQKNRTKLRDELNAYRLSWETLANRHLERHGHDARIDMGRTRDGDSIHLGKAAKGMEGRGVETDRGNVRRERDALAAARAEVAELEALQRDAFHRQGQERAGAAWDGEYTPGVEADLQSREDRMSPEQARAQWAAQLRNLEDTSATYDRDLAGKKSAPVHGSEASRPHEREAQRSWTKQDGGWDGLTREQQGNARRSWEAWTLSRGGQGGFDLPDYVAYVQTREAARKVAERPAPASKLKPTSPGGSPDVADERRAWASRLRDMDAQPPGPVRSPPPIAQKAKVRSQGRAIQVDQPALAHLRAAVAAGRSRLRTLGAKLEGVFGAVMARINARNATPGGGSARDDTSSRKVNAEIAAEARAQARAETARKAHVDREIAREFDKQQDERERQEAHRVKHSMWKEELRLSEAEAAAERLRQSIERPQTPDQGREWTP